MLRFTVAPTGTGDVHVRVSSRDGSSHDDAGEDDDATTRLSRIPPATHLYPLDPNPLDAFLGVGAAERARANAADARARAARRDRRPTGGRAPPPRPAPSRLGTLRPEDHRGAHPPAPRPRDRRRRVGPSHADSPARPEHYTSPETPDRGRMARGGAGRRRRVGDSSSLARQPGAASDLGAGIPRQRPVHAGRRRVGDRRRGGGVGRARGDRATRQRRLARRVRGWRVLRHPPRVRPLAVGGSARGGGGEPGRRSRSRSRRGVDARRSPPRRHPRRERRRRRVSGRGRLGRLGRLGRNLRHGPLRTMAASAERPAETVDLDPEAELEALLRSVDPARRAAARRARLVARRGRTPAGISGR